MGKSNKKIKSDRINALRKQYDAFIEEDKKRKERNEYILGRLDKMRHSTALVPVRHKAASQINRPAPIYHLGYQQEVPAPRDIQPSAMTKSQLIRNIPIPTADDTYLIQEISKNYILIPKLRSPFMNNYTQATPVHDTPVQEVLQNTSKCMGVTRDTNDNTDWKSKYDILNTLKQVEKDKEPVKFINDVSKLEVLSKETASIDVNDKMDAYCDNDLNADKNASEIGNKYLDDLPEKDMSVKTNVNNSIIHSDSVSYEDAKKANDDLKTTANNSEAYSDYKLTASDPASYENTNKTNDILAASGNDSVGDIDYKIQNINLEEDYPVDTNTAEEVLTYPEYEDYNYTEPPDAHPLEDHINYEENSEPVYDVNITSEDIYDGNIYTTDEANLIYQPEVLAEQLKQSADLETAAYVDEQDSNQIQVINSDELLQEIHSPSVPDPNSTNYVEYATENTANVDFQMTGTPEQHGQNIEMGSINDVKEIIPSEEEQVDTACIEAFDTEQREMFYSENTTENLAYKPSDVNPYEGYQQNPTDQQNQNYPYFETPVDIGENEEEALRYDQTYHQQYVDSYEKSYKQDPEQKQLEYGDFRNYNEMLTEDMEDLQHQQTDDIKEVELVLDTEDGYMEPKVNASEAKIEVNIEQTGEKSKHN